MGPVAGGPPSAAGLPAGVPDQLGLYRLTRPLGQGGIGMVFEGRHRLLDQRVAVKVLHPRLAADPHFVARFRREMAAFGRVPDHPNLTRAAYAGEDAGVLYLVMEFVDGADLARVLDRRGPLAAADACEAVRQALAGLTAVARAGLVHRDLKPGNLILTPDGTVKILDLGLALLREPDGGGDLTPSGVTMGTLDYLAPEQAADPRRVDARADVYSLGCTLYKLVTGRPPFPGRPSVAEKVLAHATEPFPPLGPAAPPGLDAVLARMTAKAPADRYPDPAAAEAALRPFAAGHRLGGLVGADPDTADWAGPRSYDTPGPGGTTPGPYRTTAAGTTRTAAARRPRSRWAWAAGLAAAAAAAGVAAYAATRPPAVTTDRVEPAGQTGPAVPPVPPAEPAVPPPPADGVLPAGTAPRPLDALAPFHVHDLLDRPPVEAHWHPAGGAAARAYDPLTRVFRVDAPRYGLFHLGTVTRPDYTVEVQINQSRWKGGVGVYLGYRPDPAGGHVFQYLMFEDRSTRDGKPLAVLTRGRGRVGTGPDGDSPSWEARADEPVPTPAQSCRVLVDVVGFRLSRIRLDLDREVRTLVHRDVAATFTPDDARGAVGLLARAGSCAFTEVRVRVTDDR